MPLPSLQAHTLLALRLLRPWKPSSLKRLYHETPTRTPRPPDWRIFGNLLADPDDSFRFLSGTLGQVQCLLDAAPCRQFPAAVIPTRHKAQRSNALAERPLITDETVLDQYASTVITPDEPTAVWNLTCPR